MDENGGVIVTNTECQYNYKGTIQVGWRQNEKFVINLEVKASFKNGYLESSRISFSPDSESLGKHEIAARALAFSINEKLKKVIPQVITNALLEGEIPLTYNLQGVVEFPCTFLPKNQGITWEKSPYRILQEIKEKMEDEFGLQKPSD